MVTNEEISFFDKSRFWPTLLHFFWQLKQFLMVGMVFLRSIVYRNWCKQSLLVQLWYFKFRTNGCSNPNSVSHQKNVSSNQLFSDFFHKNVTFTKLFPKMCETTSAAISTLWHNTIFCKNVVKLTFLLKELYCKLISRKSFEMGEKRNYHTTIISVQNFVKSTI